MRISDWSSDVCSSDLFPPRHRGLFPPRPLPALPGREQAQPPTARSAAGRPATGRAARISAFLVLTARLAPGQDRARRAASAASRRVACPLDKPAPRLLWQGPGYVPCVRPRPGPPLELGSHAPEEGPRHRHPPPAGRHRDPHDGTLRLPPQPGGPADEPGSAHRGGERSEEHTSELQSLMRSSYAVFCLKKKNQHQIYNIAQQIHTNTV